MAAGLVAMLLVGLLYAWSLFRPYLSEMFPSWSATDLSMVFTVSMITFSLSMFVCGKLQIKCGCKVTLLITAVLMGVGFFGASSLDPADPSGSLARLVVFYGVLCGAMVAASVRRLCRLFFSRFFLQRARRQQELALSLVM